MIISLWLVLALCSVVWPLPTQNLEEELRLQHLRSDLDDTPYTFEYLSLEALINRVKYLQAEVCPEIMRYYSIGKSVQGKTLLVVRLANQTALADSYSPSSSIESPLLAIPPNGKPKFKYIGNMHGDETVGRSILINLIEYLCYQYPKDEDAKYLVDNIDIHILPSMNPDGFYATMNGHPKRENANGVDLNRDFPDPWKKTSAKPEPETQAIMDWTALTQFVLSANFHGGSVVVNYPWDGNPPSTAPQDPPDLLTFQYISKLYSLNQPKMKAGGNCGDNFPDGITEGYKWYALYGGMQDFNYQERRVMEVTIELSCVKFPDASTLQAHWNDNKLSLLLYMKAVLTGVSGTVWINGLPIEGAEIRVDGIDYVIKTDENGDYWRILAPGQNYVVRMYYDGEELSSKEVSLKETNYGFFVLNLGSQENADTVSDSTRLYLSALAIAGLCLVLLATLFLGIRWYRRKRRERAQMILLRNLGNEDEDDEDDFDFEFEIINKENFESKESAGQNEGEEDGEDAFGKVDSDNEKEKLNVL